MRPLVFAEKFIGCGVGAVIGGPPRLYKGLCIPPKGSPDGELAIRRKADCLRGNSKTAWQLRAVPLSSRLRRDTFPVNGDSFKACHHAQVKATAFAIYYFYIPLFVNL